MYVQYAHLFADSSHLFTSPPRLTPLQAHERTLDLIPQCIWLGNTVRSRYTGPDLEVVSKAARDAIATAIAAGEYTQAIEWFEAGRSIIWSQVTQLFTPLEDLRLRRAHPTLADELDRISKALYALLEYCWVTLRPEAGHGHLQPHNVIVSETTTNPY